MEYAIEQKVISMLEVGLADFYDNTPAYILPYAEDWEDYNDYPAIIVHIDNEEITDDQISNVPSYIKAYMLSIYVITVDDLWEDVTRQRGIIKSRIQTIMQNNHTLDLIQDDNEKVFSSRYVGTDFTIGGFITAWQGVARIKYEIWTEIRP